MSNSNLKTFTNKAGTKFLAVNEINPGEYETLHGTFNRKNINAAINVYGKELREPVRQRIIQR